MSIARKIFINTVAQTAGKIIAIAVGLLNLGLLTRYLGEQGFGQYSTVLAFLGFVVTFADLGLYLYVVREISREGAASHKIISNALGLRLVLSLASLLCGAVIALFFPYAAVVKKTMFLGILALVFASLYQVLIGIFQKHLVQYLTLIAEVAGRVFNLLLVYLFIRQGLGLPYFILALTVGNFVIFSLTVLYAKRYESFGIAFDFQFWKKILAVSWPLAFSVILNLIYFKTDTLILSVYHSAESVGVYSLPYKILEVSLAFPGMFVGLIMPILSRHAFSTWDKFQAVLQRAFDALLLTAIPMVISTWFFSEQIINLVKGQVSYQDSPAVFRILIFATAIIFLGTLFGYAVVAVDRQKAMIWGYLAGAVIGLVSYFLLIPKYSYFGAAYGTVLTELVVACVAYVLVRQSMPAGLSLKTALSSLPAVLILILFFKIFHFGWVVEMASGLIVYLVLLFAFRALPLELIKQLTVRE